MVIDEAMRAAFDALVLVEAKRRYGVTSLAAPVLSYPRLRCSFTPVLPFEGTNPADSRLVEWLFDNLEGFVPGWGHAIRYEKMAIEADGKHVITVEARVPYYKAML
jgi:hypothetical protein